jgi:hypothetical protein
VGDAKHRRPCLLLGVSGQQSDVDLLSDLDCVSTLGIVSRDFRQARSSLGADGKRLIDAQITQPAQILSRLRLMLWPSPWPQRQESKMRQGLIISLTAIVTAALTVLSMNVINGPAGNNSARYEPVSMDVMEMMKSARNLPNEAFDAY